MPPHAHRRETDWRGRKGAKNRPPAAALSAASPDAAQPDRLDQPRAQLRRGRPADRALPALPRREGQGRNCHDHGRRLRHRRAGLAPRLRQSQALRPRHPAAVPPPGRGLPRLRHRGAVPDHAPGAAQLQLCRRLAAADGALAGPRTGAPQLPEGDGGLGHRAGGRRLCPRRQGLPRRRPRRDRNRVLRTPARRLLVAADQPAGRRLGRQPGQPPALRLPGAGGDPRRRRTRLHRRHPHGGG